MKNIIKYIENTKGYISIETLIISGLVIGLGAFVITKFSNKSLTSSDKSLELIDTVQFKDFS